MQASPHKFQDNPHIYTHGGTVKKPLPDSIQKVAILGSKFPTSTVSPTVQKKINNKGNMGWNKKRETKKRPGSRMYFELIFTVVSKELPPYFSRASFIFKNPWVEVRKIIVPENRQGNSAKSAGMKKTNSQNLNCRKYDSVYVSVCALSNAFTQCCADLRAWSTCSTRVMRL